MASVGKIGASTLVALLVVLGIGTARADAACSSTSMYVVAHQDDDLLFASPALLQDIRSKRCVVTTYLTAGDDGKGPEYWEGREAGIEAAYAQMAGVANVWTESVIVAAGHSIAKRTLVGEPNINVTFMRLPDGGISGEGTDLYGFQSLLKLWDGGNPGSGRPTISNITAVDGSATYSYVQLIETLAALMQSFDPRQVAAMDWAAGFFQGDHPDHIASAYFTREAQKQYAAPHRLLAYEGYEIAARPENVFEELLGGKSFAFYTYGAHDSGACSSEAGCTTTPYAEWLKRQYVVATETTGVVAHAGYAQEAAPGETVQLDGSQSSDESGEPLAFLWTQTGGPAVSLSSSETATPGFVAPSHPTVLTFSLRVSDGIETSSPDTVTVRLPSADPTPVAVVGPDQVVSSGAAVQLDGSESWDPNSMPLEFAWVQTAGPPVSLSGSSTATPTFTAPRGPVEVTFELVVSNGSETSAPVSMSVEVLGIAPTFTSVDAASFTTGASGTFTIDTEGSPVPSIAERGSLPAGLVFSDNGDGTATISGTPESSAAPPAASSDYPIEFEAENSVGTATQPFTITVHNPGTPPQFGGTGEASFETGAFGSFMVSASAAPTAALSLEGDLPEGLEFADRGDGSAEFFGVPSDSSAPPASSRSYHLRVIAENPAGTATRNIVLTVINRGTPPSFTLSPGVAHVFAERFVSVPFAATGAPAPTLAAGGPLPAGLAFVSWGPGAGAITGKPEAPGSHRLRVDAASGAGSASALTKLVVERLPRLGRSKLQLSPGRRARRTVRLVAPSAASARCTGETPRGLSCGVRDGNIVVRSTKSLTRTGSFPLTVRVSSPAGVVLRRLRVVVRDL